MDTSNMGFNFGGTWNTRWVATDSNGEELVIFYGLHSYSALTIIDTGTDTKEDEKLGKADGNKQIRIKFEARRLTSEGWTFLDERILNVVVAGDTTIPPTATTPPDNGGTNADPNTTTDPNAGSNPTSGGGSPTAWPPVNTGGTTPTAWPSGGGDGGIDWPDIKIGTGASVWLWVIVAVLVAAIGAIIYFKVVK